MQRLLRTAAAFLCTFFAANNLTVSAQETWEELGIPFMVTVEQMVASPNGSVFAVAWKPAVGSKVYRSDDQGRKWSALPLPDKFYRLAVNSDGVLFLIDATHVYRSLDNGDSWEEIAAGPSMFTTIAVSPDGVVAVGNIDYNGPFVMLSFDDGATWQTRYLGGYHEQMFLYFNSTEVLFMATENYLERSNDYGVAWIDISTGGYGQPSHDALAFGANDEIYYGMAWENGMYRSTDTGNTWERVLNTGTGAIAVNSSNEVFAGQYRSADGINWTVMQEFIHAEVEAILIDANDVIYVATRFDIRVSTDNGQTWSVANTGLTDAEITDMTSYQEHVFVVKNGRIFHSADNGDFWKQSEPALSETLDNFVYDYRMESLKISPSGEVFAFGRYEIWIGEFFIAMRSDDFGETWVPFASRQLTDLAFGQGDDLFMLTNLRFFRSADHGIHWEKMTNEPGCFNPMRAVADNAGNVYVNSTICNPPVIYHTPDNGNTWLTRDLPAGARADRLYINSLATVYAHKAEGGIFFSEDQGITWNPIVTEPWFQTVAVLTIDSYDNLHASTNAGLFMSPDNGNTWIPLGTGLPPGTSVNCLSAGESGYVYASTQQGKLYRQQYRVAAENLPAAELALFPNPAKDYVNLTLKGKPAGMQEDIQILDLTGRIVKRFTLEGGNAKVDVSTLGAGVYVVNSSRVSRKLIKE